MPLRAGPNYVRWNGLTSTNLVVSGNGGTQRWGISGFQIVDVPEPSSLGLLTLAGGLLLVRRRR